MNHSNKLVEIYIARGEAEAQIIKGVLDSYGIPNILKAQASPSIHVFTVDGMGQVTILVRAEDADTARELINEEQK